VLGEVRKAKTTAKRSLRTEVSRVEITGSSAMLDALRLGETDLCEAGRIAEIRCRAVSDEALGVSVTLANEDEPDAGAQAAEG